jgi:hypothetical protein
MKHGYNTYNAKLHIMQYRYIPTFYIQQMEVSCVLESMIQGAKYTLLKHMLLGHEKTTYHSKLVHDI